ICDGLSLSTVAHELLLALCDADNNIFSSSLNWPITMEDAVKRSLSACGKIVTFGKFIFAALHWRLTTSPNISRIPIASVDFPLNDIDKYCHTEASYGMLNKEETQKLIEKCRREGVTVTSAIGSAILCVTSTLVSVDNNQATQIILAIAADTRRRCIP